jgi:hypothetical protein
MDGGGTTDGTTREEKRRPPHYVASLFFQDGRGMSALGSGLSTLPEAVGVMAGAQLASRVLYRALGPRRNIPHRSGLSPS